MLFICRTASLPNFLGTFVQPNLTINNNNNNSINNNKSTITVVQTPNGFQEIKVDEDSADMPMVVDDTKLQQQQQISISLSEQLVESVEKSVSKNRQQNSIENNNQIIKSEDNKVSSPSSPSFIDINNLPMVFDDTKLFQNVSSTHTI